MNKTQWITIGASVILVIVLFAATKNQFFGERKAKSPAPQANSSHEGLSIDSILYYSKQNLSQEQVARLNQLENSVSRGDVVNQKVSVYHQLAHFWGDSARLFPPYAYYTAEAARLENSEKSLTFAAHLFLDNLVNQQDHRLKDWVAEQAKDLFERSLKINPDNDSAKVGLGAVMVFADHSTPMEGIAKIREVLAKDSTNVYAHMTLGKASLLSGQMDRAVERLKTVTRLQPGNLEAILLLADTYERLNNKTAAAEWYQKSLPYVPKPDLRKEIENRINELKK